MSPECVFKLHGFTLFFTLPIPYIDCPDLSLGKFTTLESV